MPAPERISPRWSECIVAASGPSLTPEVAERCRGHHVLAVQDAYRVLPFAEVLYGCDNYWWQVQHTHPPYVEAIKRFAGEKWSSHDKRRNHKLVAAAHYGLRLVAGADEEGFSFDPAVIHYGSNSGFQAVNLALLFGARRIVLVGFDMRTVNGQRHFFGNHPARLRNRGQYERFAPVFERAARKLPKGTEIINCTPGSALKCFPVRKIEEVF